MASAMWSVVVVQPVFYSINTAPCVVVMSSRARHASFLTSPVTASSICLSDRPSSDCCFSVPNSAPCQHVCVARRSKGGEGEP